MTEGDQVLSREKQINKLFADLAGVPDPKSRIAMPGTGIAEPGDLLFFIHHSNKPSLHDNGPRTFGELVRRPLCPFIRRCHGFAKDDLDGWHVAIYLIGRKRRHHQRMNLWMLRSTPRSLKATGGVHVQQLSCNALANRVPPSQTRMEILQFRGINKDQREMITRYASAVVGSGFDYSMSRHAALTWVLGLPNFLHDQRLFACQSLVVAAYSAAGIYFPHPHKSFPSWNIGRLLGHPLGHPKDRVSPKYPYLMDQHIYSDPRFRVKAAVYQKLGTNEFHIETGNLEKYSWNPTLGNKYGIANSIAASQA